MATIVTENKYTYINTDDNNKYKTDNVNKKSNINNKREDTPLINDNTKDIKFSNEDIKEISKALDEKINNIINVFNLNQTNDNFPLNKTPQNVQFSSKNKDVNDYYIDLNKNTVSANGFTSEEIPIIINKIQSIYNERTEYLDILSRVDINSIFAELFSSVQQTILHFTKFQNDYAKMIDAMTDFAVQMTNKIQEEMRGREKEVEAERISQYKNQAIWTIVMCAFVIVVAVVATALTAGAATSALAPIIAKVVMVITIVYQSSKICGAASVLCNPDIALNNKLGMHLMTNGFFGLFDKSETDYSRGELFSQILNIVTLIASLGSSLAPNAANYAGQAGFKYTMLVIYEYIKYGSYAGDILQLIGNIAILAQSTAEEPESSKKLNDDKDDDFIWYQSFAQGLSGLIAESMARASGMNKDTRMIMLAIINGVTTVLGSVLAIAGPQLRTKNAIKGDKLMLQKLPFLRKTKMNANAYALIEATGEASKLNKYHTTTNQVSSLFSGVLDSISILLNSYLQNKDAVLEANNKQIAELNKLLNDALKRMQDATQNSMDQLLIMVKNSANFAYADTKAYAKRW